MKANESTLITSFQIFMNKKNKHNELVGSDIERSDDRIEKNGEVFTPIEMCYEMIDSLPNSILKNPKSTFIDPAAGNGNFLVSIKERLLQYHSEQHILDNMLYAIELMKDNHKELCERLGVSTTHPHYVCQDAITYDYSFGEPQGIELFLN